MRWLREGMGEAAPGMATTLGALDAFVNPGAERARALLKHENERVLPTPSPGDRLLHENRIVIRVRAPGPPATS